MATRNRIIYQSEAVFASNIGSGTDGNLTSAQINDLQRVTEVGHDVDLARQDVNVFGKLASVDRIVLEEPTVGLNLSYYLADGFNESGVGLTTYKVNNAESNCLSGILANNDEAERNYYILTVQEGVDAVGVSPTSVGNSGALGIVGIGNSFLSNYTVNLNVGDIPSADVSFEASNITFLLSHPDGVQNPALIKTGAVSTQFTGLVSLPAATTGSLTTTVLRPGDVVVDFGSAGLDMGGAILPGMTEAATKQSAHVQSVSIEVPLSRTPQNRLGNFAAFSRELDVPISVTLNVSANLADISTGTLVDLICSSSDERDITVSLYGPCAADDASPDELNMQFKLKGATLDSENFSSNVGDNKTVDLTFSSQVGGPNDQTKGLFISGRHGA